MVNIRKNWVILTIPLLVIIGLIIFVVADQNTKQSSNNAKPTSGTNNLINASPSSSGAVNNSKALQDCLNRARDSEAQQSIIYQAIQDCYNKYR